MDGQPRTLRSDGDDNGSIPADQGAEVVRALIATGGRSLRSLARRTDWSFQSWSAYQTGDRPVPASAMRQLLTVTGVTTDFDLGRHATALLATYQSAPGTTATDHEMNAVDQLSDSATKPSDHAGPVDAVPDSPVGHAADDAADETTQVD